MSNEDAMSLVKNWAKMTPTPRAFLTVSTATDADLCARVWKQSTTFPFTRVEFRDPAVQLLQRHEPIWKLNSKELSEEEAEDDKAYLASVSSALVDAISSADYMHTFWVET
jgi:hypothetical protein